MKNKKQLHIVALVIAIFFVISLITNILGSLEPNIADSFKLSSWMAAFLPFSFFIAYGVMSIPSGILNEKFGAKPVLLLAFLLSFIGVAIFVFFTSYVVALFSLFTIGLGMAILQVVINHRVVKKTLHLIQYWRSYFSEARLPPAHIYIVTLYLTSTLPVATLFWTRLTKWFLILLSGYPYIGFLPLLYC